MDIYIYIHTWKINHILVIYPWVVVSGTLFVLLVPLDVQASTYCFIWFSTEQWSWEVVVGSTCHSFWTNNCQHLQHKRKGCLNVRGAIAQLCPPGIHTPQHRSRLSPTQCVDSPGPRHHKQTESMPWGVCMFFLHCLGVAYKMRMFLCSRTTVTYEHNSWIKVWGVENWVPMFTSRSLLSSWGFVKSWRVWVNRMVP